MSGTNPAEAALLAIPVAVVPHDAEGVVGGACDATLTPGQQALAAACTGKETP